MPTLEQAGAILTVDLGAIRENFRQLRQRMGNGNCAAVVKADAYGLGAAKVANALLEEGCRTFFVAHVSEGIALRKALGPDHEIHVLNGVPAGAELDCAAADLLAVVNSTEQFAAWRDAARRTGKRLRVTVQVDSGMSRLGLSAAEVDGIAVDPTAFDGLELRLVMSHLACADEPDNPANAAQRRSFDALRAKLPAAPASLSNSSGIFLGEPYHYDLARPGAALYGVNPTPGRDNPMRQAVRLEAKVIQTRELTGGAGIGYGYAYFAAGALRTATISLGYADGWPRRAGLAAWLDGARLPFVGRVSMDTIILDISTIPPGRLQPGDLVELIGERQTVDGVALLSGTIGYEILTGLGHRFHRRYEDG